MDLSCYTTFQSTGLSAIFPPFAFVVLHDISERRFIRYLQALRICRVTRQTQLQQFDGGSHLVVVDIDIALGDGHAAVTCNFLQDPDTDAFGRK